MPASRSTPLLRRRRRTLLSMGVVLLSIMSLAACGDDDDDGATATRDTAATTTTAAAAAAEPTAYSTTTFQPAVELTLPPGWRVVDETRGNIELLHRSGVEGAIISKDVVRVLSEDGTEMPWPDDLAGLWEGRSDVTGGEIEILEGATNEVRVADLATHLESQDRRRFIGYDAGTWNLVNDPEIWRVAEVSGSGGTLVGLMITGQDRTEELKASFDELLRSIGFASS